MIPLERSSGILMHITSLPSPYGVGTLGKEAREFADFLVRTGQTYWQVLPVGPTGFGDSPYQSFSSFAGNPYLIDLDLLVEDKLLEESDYTELDWGTDPLRVDYGKLYENKWTVLRVAYENGYLRDLKAVGKFIREQEHWIFDYGLFMALKDYFEGKCWQDWPEDIRQREPEAMAHYHHELRNDVNFYIYVQFLFYRQWKAFREDVNKLGIQLIGDIPIYVAPDSADAWANPDVFWLDEDKRPVCVAGCPPDYFSPTGQLWGNPLYDWEYLKKTGYRWWIDRIRGVMSLFDVVRIDHFRGFEAYYAIPYGNPTAEHGEWLKGPEMALFRAIRRGLSRDVGGGSLPIIAEDLGLLTPEVQRLLEKTGFPGMKVLEFAFDSDETNPYLPHNYHRNCVVYVGTHDNDTLKGWFTTCGQETLKKAEDYLNLTNEEGYNWGMIRGAMGSVARLSMVTMQDYLFLDTSARMNAPSSVGTNWQWRMDKNAITPELEARIATITRRYGRTNQNTKA